MTVGSVPEALKRKGRAKTQNSASKKVCLLGVKIQICSSLLLDYEVLLNVMLIFSFVYLTIKASSS